MIWEMRVFDDLTCKGAVPDTETEDWSKKTKYKTRTKQVCAHRYMIEGRQSQRMEVLKENKSIDTSRLKTTTTTTKNSCSVYLQEIVSLPPSNSEYFPQRCGSSKTWMPRGPHSNKWLPQAFSERPSTANFGVSVHTSTWKTKCLLL